MTCFIPAYHDFTSEGYVIDSWHQLTDPLAHFWNKRWRRQALCILFEQIALRNKDELFLHWAPKSCAYLCYMKTLSLFSCSSSQFGHSVHSWSIFCWDRPCQVIFLNGFASSMNLISLLPFPGSHEFDITLSSLLAQFSSRECQHLHENLLFEEICSVHTRERHPTLMVRPHNRGGPTGIVLFDPDGINVSLSFKL